MYPQVYYLQNQLPDTSDNMSTSKKGKTKIVWLVLSFARF